MIEVEQRSFITREKHDELLNKFKTENIEIKTESQITYYYKGEKDFRLMITKDYCQLWVKEGKLHDDAREELVVKVEKEYEESLKKMLNKIGFMEQIKWYRVRNSLMWNNIYVTLDYTHGYGYVLEMEKLVDSNHSIEAIKDLLQSCFEQLGVEITDKKSFLEKYEDYKINWIKYTKDIKEDDFTN